MCGPMSASSSGTSRSSSASRREPSTTPMPLVIFVHGGGYTQGGKEEKADDAIGYARAGFVTARVAV